MPLKGRLLACHLCVALLIGCQSSETRRSSIEVFPKQALVDEAVHVRVLGLMPSEKVTVHAECTDFRNQRWESHADFQVDRNGIVDLASLAPVSGTYSGIDSAGLFWSMAAVASGKLQQVSSSNQARFGRQRAPAHYDNACGRN